jgi:hypothetical protein
MSDPWRQADRVSDQIVDLLNREIARPDSSVLEVLAGQLLALKAFLLTCPHPGLGMLDSLRVGIDKSLDRIEEMLAGDRVN